MNQAMLQARAKTAAVAGSGRAPCVPALPMRPVRVHRAVSQQRRVATAVQAKPSVQEQRWASQISDGRVKNISAKDVNGLIAEGWTVLDVRPPNEQSKAPLADAVHVPLFVPDESNDLPTFIKKATDFAMGSWWLGGTHYVANNDFLAQVQAQIPKDARVVVACQKGLRSLAACEQLARAGYSTLAWINGGLDTAVKADGIKTSNGKDIRYAGIGGLSESLGWTDVQREEKQSSFMGGFENVIKLFSLILLADMLLFAYEQIKFWQENPGSGPL